MSTRLNSFILPDNIIKDMNDRIDETRKKKIELGFALCTDINNNTIKKGSECIGTNCSIERGKCDINQRFVGDYHTHLVTVPNLSLTDMLAGCYEHIECVGSSKVKGIRCFVRKTQESSCFNDINPYVNKELELMKRTNDLYDTLKSPKSILRFGVRNLLKAMADQDKNIAEYQSNKARLLDKHFNRFII